VIKTCTKCGVSKSLSEFHKRKNVASGLMSHCKKCNAKKGRDYRKSNPEKMKAFDKLYAAQKWIAHLRRKYRITIKEYEDMLSLQSGKCAICGTDKSGGRTDKMHVDHNHSSKEVRGLLCSSCNQMLGYAKDNVRILKSAVVYLSMPKRQKRSLKAT
jgi:hypothetical protein